MRAPRQTVLRTRRLKLRPLTAEDAGRIAMFVGDWDVARMTSRVPYPYSAASARHWIDDLAEGEVVFGIEREKSLIGLCGYVPAGDRAVEIGYWIGKPWWGNGYATEAARALVSHCFGKMGMRRIVCGHFIDNPASQRVIAKLGFRPTGTAMCWCEARQGEFEAARYERKRRPFMARLGLRAA